MDEPGLQQNYSLKQNLTREEKRVMNRKFRKLWRKERKFLIAQFPKHTRYFMEAFSVETFRRRAVCYALTGRRDEFYKEQRDYLHRLKNIKDRRFRYIY